MDDLISRQELLDFIDSMRELVENGRRMIRRADTLPSVERKKGEWEVAIGYDQNKKVMCTECRLMSYEPTPFCPNCGAEMRGGEG